MLILYINYMNGGKVEIWRIKIYIIKIENYNVGPICQSNLTVIFQATKNLMHNLLKCRNKK